MGRGLRQPDYPLGRRTWAEISISTKPIRCGWPISAGNSTVHLQDDHHLEPRYEVILYIAAVLHEIGLFISNASHHKHSLYIINNSEIFGLSRKDVRLVGLSPAITAGLRRSRHTRIMRHSTGKAAWSSPSSPPSFAWPMRWNVRTAGESAKFAAIPLTKAK